ncbi:MAG TPA: XdhC family protein [Dissulfurispiraceae bacterium]|nr:XdhC family protein [Dissulfurispiraceae bacterium]
MKKIYREMVELLHKKENFVVATIFDQAGSAPRTTGAKMLVKTDGTISGSIGGGRLEAEAIQAARNVLTTGRPIIHTFLLTGEDAASMDMICGGQGRVLLDFIDSSDESNRLIFEEAYEVIAHNGRGRLITALFSEQNPATQHLLIPQDGNAVGRFDVSGQVKSKLASVPASASVRTETIDDQQFVIEFLRNAGTVYIFGAGHVSQKIAPVSEMAGFKTVVLDDRAEYANRERFPWQTEIILLESFDRLPQLSVDEDSYMVIVTRGHLHDKTILAQALKTGAGYIGMIGSRRKRDKIFEALANEGFGKNDFDRVYSPIGTDIGAETPEELAISIVGELIKVRAAKEKCR